MTTEERKRQIKEWQQASTRQILLRFNVHKDADVLARLGAVDNKVDYIRRLVREDIAAGRD